MMRRAPLCLGVLLGQPGCHTPPKHKLQEMGLCREVARHSYSPQDLPFDHRDVAKALTSRQVGQAWTGAGGEAWPTWVNWSVKAKPATRVKLLEGGCMHSDIPLLVVPATVEVTAQVGDWPVSATYRGDLVVRSPGGVVQWASCTAEFEAPDELQQLLDTVVAVDDVEDATVTWCVGLPPLTGHPDLPEVSVPWLSARVHGPHVDGLRVALSGSFQRPDGVAP